MKEHSFTLRAHKVLRPFTSCLPHFLENKLRAEVFGEGEDSVWYSYSRKAWLTREMFRAMLIQSSPFLLRKPFLAIVFPFAFFFPILQCWSTMRYPIWDFFSRTDQMHLGPCCHLMIVCFSSRRFTSFEGMCLSRVVRKHPGTICVLS